MGGPISGPWGGVDEQAGRIRNRDPVEVRRAEQAFGRGAHDVVLPLEGPRASCRLVDREAVAMRRAVGVAPQEGGPGTYELEPQGRTEAQGRRRMPDHARTMRRCLMRDASAANGPSARPYVLTIGCIAAGNSTIDER